MPPMTFTMEGGAVITLPPEQYTVEFKIPEVKKKFFWVCMYCWCLLAMNTGWMAALHTHMKSTKRTTGARSHPRPEGDQEQPLRPGPDCAEQAVHRGPYFDMHMYIIMVMDIIITLTIITIHLRNNKILLNLQILSFLHLNQKLFYKSYSKHSNKLTSDISVSPQKQSKHGKKMKILI